MQSSADNSADDPAFDAKNIDIDVDYQSVPTADLRTDFLQLVNGTNRGLNASLKTRAEIFARITELEARAEDDPALRVGGDGERDALVGTWRLVFTNSLDILSLGLVPVSLGPIFQNVEDSGEDNLYNIYNIVEVEPLYAPVLNSIEALERFGPTKSVLTVKAEGRVSEDDASRIDLRFVKSSLECDSFFGLEGSSFPKVQVPLNSPVGYIDTTYVDDVIRIGKSPSTPNAPSNPNYYVLVRD